MIGVSRRPDLLPESTSSAASGKKNRIWRLSLYENGSTHLDPATKLTSHVTEEPILRHGKAWMSLESFDQELPIPDAYCSVRKCRRADLTSKCALQSAKFVLDILSLLA